MKLKNRLLSIMMVVALVMSYMQMVSFADETDTVSGTCGTCTWVIDANGVMTISGGEMDEWEDYPTWHAYIDKIIKVETTGEIILKTGQYMFDGCENITSLDVSSFDTSNVTDMEGMFLGCKKLTSLDVSNFDTSNVTRMGDMFLECNNLTSLDVSGFDTSNVTCMPGMFYRCENITSLDVSNFDTSNVTDMSSMFFRCKNVTGLDTGNFDTSNVTDMSAMFSGCTSLASLDVSGFDTSNVINIGSMFRECNDLTSIDISGFNTSNVTEMGYMFCGCQSITSLDVSHFNTSNVTDMSTMFSGCTSLASLDVSGFNTSNVTAMDYMFNGCQSLTSLDLKNFDTSNAMYMAGMFSGCVSLNRLKVGNKWSYNARDPFSDAEFPVDMKNSFTGEEFAKDTTIPEGAAVYTAIETGGATSPEEDIVRKYIIGTDTWDFCNCETGAIKYKDFCKFLGSNTYAKAIYLSYKNGFGGICFGMSALIPCILEHQYPFKSNVRNIHDYQYGEVKDWLNLAQTYQVMPRASITERINIGKLNKLYKAVKDEVYNNGEPVVVSFVSNDPHEVLVTSIIRDTPEEVIIGIYDPNNRDNKQYGEGDTCYSALRLLGANNSYTQCFWELTPREVTDYDEVPDEFRIDVTNIISFDNEYYESFRKCTENGEFEKSTYWLMVVPGDFDGTSLLNSTGTAIDLIPINIKSGDNSDAETNLYWIDDSDGTFNLLNVKTGNEIKLASSSKCISIIPENDSDITIKISDDIEDTELSVSSNGNNKAHCEYQEEQSDGSILSTSIDVQGNEAIGLTINNDNVVTSGVSAVNVEQVEGYIDDEDAELIGQKVFSKSVDQIEEDTEFNIDIQRNNATDNTKDDTSADGAVSSSTEETGSTSSSSSGNPAGTTENMASVIGTTAKVSGSTYKITSTSAVTFTKAVNKKSVTVPATVKIDGKSYKVTTVSANAFKGGKIRTITIGKNVKTIKANAFKGSKATKIVLKTKKLKKKTVKGSLKESKVKTIQVKVGKKAINKKYVTTYKKIFTKKNVGKTVTVK